MFRQFPLDIGECHCRKLLHPEAFSDTTVRSFDQYEVGMERRRCEIDELDRARRNGNGTLRKFLDRVLYESSAICFSSKR